MVQSGGMSLVKYLLFIFNFIFVVCGIAIIVVGVKALNTSRDYGIKIGGQYFAVPVLIIVIGSIIFLIAFLGCCGAVQESHCMLITFGVLIGLIFIVEVAAGIAIIVYKDKFDAIIRKSIEGDFNDSESKKHEKMDYIQQKLKCCGVNGTKDYKSIIPESCCENLKEGDSCSSDKAFKVGCVQAFIELVNSNSKIAGGVTLGLAFVEILGIIFACCLAKEIKREYGVA